MKFLPSIFEGPPMTSWKPPLNIPITNHYIPIVNHDIPITNHYIPIVNHDIPIDSTITIPFMESSYQIITNILPYKSI